METAPLPGYGEEVEVPLPEDVSLSVVSDPPEVESEVNSDLDNQVGSTAFDFVKETQISTTTFTQFAACDCSPGYTGIVRSNYFRDQLWTARKKLLLLPLNLTRNPEIQAPGRDTPSTLPNGGQFLAS